MKDNGDLIQYFKCQTDICYCSQLYGDLVEEHGSKVLMLFAEIYAYMVNEFGITVAPSIIIKYENSENFKAWFWRIKHQLGLELLVDPDFYEIGRWIGKGFFLKIVLSIINYNRVFFEECYHDFNYDEIVKKAILKQHDLLDELLSRNFFRVSDKAAIELVPNGYKLLTENIILDSKNHVFHENNLIL